MTERTVYRLSDAAHARIVKALGELSLPPSYADVHAALKAEGYVRPGDFQSLALYCRENALNTALCWIACAASQEAQLLRDALHAYSIGQRHLQSALNSRGWGRDEA